MSKPETHKVEAGGGIVFKIKSHGKFWVLLIRRNGVWDLPKGKKEKDETFEMCAVREVAEETGSILPSIAGYVEDTYHEYEREGKKMGKTTRWYAMILSREEPFHPQKEEGIEEVCWVPLDKALSQVGYENLEKVLQRFRQLYT